MNIIMYFPGIAVNKQQVIHTSNHMETLFRIDLEWLAHSYYPYKYTFLWFSNMFLDGLL